jgi:hypothetical protein
MMPGTFVTAAFQGGMAGQRSSAPSIFGSASGFGPLRFECGILTGQVEWYRDYAAGSACVSAIKERLLMDTTSVGVTLQRLDMKSGNVYDVTPADQRTFTEVYVPLAKKIQSECLDIGYCVVCRSAGESGAPYVLPTDQYQLVWTNPRDGPTIYGVQQEMGKIREDCYVVMYDPPHNSGEPRSKISRCWKRLAEMEVVYHSVTYAVLHRSHVVSQTQNSKLAGEMGPLEAESFAEGLVFRQNSNYAAQNQTLVNNSVRRGQAHVAPVMQTATSAMAHSINMPAPTERVIPLNPGVTLMDTPHPEQPPDIEAIQTNLEQTVFRMYGVPVEILAGAVNRKGANDGDNAMKKYNSTLVHWQQFLSEALTQIYNKLELEPFANQSKGEWAVAVLDFQKRREQKKTEGRAEDDSSDSDTSEETSWQPRRDVDAINGGPIKPRRTTPKRPKDGDAKGSRPKRVAKRPDVIDYKRRMKQENQALVTVHRRYDIEPEQIILLRDGGIISDETATQLACARYGLDLSMCMSDAERTKQRQTLIDQEVEIDRRKQENAAKAKKQYAIPKTGSK